MRRRRGDSEGKGPSDGLVDRYLTRIAEHLEALDSLLDDLRQGDEEASEALRALGHNYRGTGASYGFPEISEAGRKLELASESELEEAALELARILGSVTEEKLRTDRILLVDDDEMVHLLVENSFRDERITLTIETTVAGAWKSLREHEFDAVILDLFLEDGDGRKVLAEMREHPTTSGVPVIVISGRGTQAMQAECFRLGADVYLSKPLDPEVLSEAVDREIKEARKTEADIRVDSVTGLPNRAALTERYDEFLASARRTGTPLVLARIEIDQFGPIQDEHGRVTAEEILADFGSVVGRAVRDQDVVGRWEGSELLGLLPGIGVEEAMSLLEEVRTEIRDREFRLLDAGEPGNSDDLSLQLTFSAGVVDAAGFDDLFEALLEAERGLVTSRARGGDQIVAHTSESETEDAPRILVVEDDDAAADLYTHRFERDGLEVRRLATGTAAARLLQEEDGRDYNLMLLDINLPGHDGFEILQMARSRPDWAEIPIVVITSMGREGHVVRAFDLGADDYVLKPFSPAELLARVHRLLR